MSLSETLLLAFSTYGLPALFIFAALAAVGLPLPVTLQAGGEDDGAVPRQRLKESARHRFQRDRQRMEAIDQRRDDEQMAVDRKEDKRREQA